MRTGCCYRFSIVAALCLVTNTAFAAERTNESDYFNRLISPERATESHSCAAGNDSFLSSLRSFDDRPREKKVIALNLTAVGAIAAVGSVSWEYCSSSFHFNDEGWFDPDTKFGGADKLGHAYSAYALTSVYNHIYRKWGYSDEKAILGGALSSWSQMTLIEIGDGFSDDHGFSWEDEVMDTIGVGMAYLRHRYPRLKEMVDFRMEWFPSPAFRHGDRSDPFTDYSGQKYLFALKPDGFLKTNNHVLKLMELHFGYYSRGYTEERRYFNDENRYIYFGIGLNMTYLLERYTGHSAGGIFDYVQVPHTYLSSSSRLN